MMPYRHTQIGYATLAGLFGGAVILLALLPKRVTEEIDLIVFSVLIVSALLFGYLTVEIEGGMLRFRFGPGLFRKTFPLSEIQSCRAVRNPWYYGWGVHLTPHGWLYNVSGSRAVEVTLKSGRSFRLGSDEPEVLARAITSVLGQHRQSGPA